jgi:16S rRNA (cytosine967-C5)-methyltransferase
VNPNILSLAERVIRRSDRAHPADDVLRLELKNQRGVSPNQALEISRMVFSYFRWRGWLEERQPISDQITRAVGLANEFATRPQAFSEFDLISRAVPAWVRDEIQITPAFARSLQAEPKLWLRTRPGQGKFVSRRLRHCRSFGDGPLSDILEYQGREDLFRTSQFHAGDFELQDLTSQAVGLVCAPAPGDTWWDACAGEGGKMLHLSDLMKNKGLIWATDRADWRLRRLKLRAARAKVFNYRTAVWECGAKLATKTKFDGVLVDAPCSGTGTWQRNPHARWTLTPGDITELYGLQTQLLARAATRVKPGGKLVYSVCSLARWETDAVAEHFESAALPFTAVPLVNPLAPETAPTTRLVLWPQQFGGNGMFIAAWVRNQDP